MADEPQKAASAAENGKGQEKAPEVGHNSENGTSAKGDEPKAATERKEEDAAPEAKKSDAHKEVYEKKYKDSKDHRKHVPGKYVNYKANVKTDYSALPASRDPAEIRKQVEFYFSDSNLNYDDYMRKLSGGADNDPVQIATLHSFKRMRRFQPAGAVVAALRESETLEVVDAKGNPAPEPVEGEEDKEVGFVAEAYVRRRVAWVDPKANAAADDNDGDTAAALEDPGLPRSIYAKGFGTETATTQFDVEAYFAPFGPVNMVRLRRKMPDRTFKGSAFVEFATEELAKAFLESDSRPRWAGETALKVMTKREYLEKQEEDIKAGKIAEDKKTKYKLYSSGGKRGERHEGGRGRDGKHDGGGRRGGHEDRNGRGDRNGRDRRGGRDGRDARDRRGGRDDRNGRDEDDWRGRRDDFQKKLKDDDGEAGADGKPAGGDAKPATSPAPPSPGKRARDEGADDGEDAGAKRAKVERAAEAVEGGNVG